MHIQEHFIRTAKPERKCYEYILSLLRIVPQGLYDLMRATGYTQSIVENILIDLEGQDLIQHNRKARNYIVVQSLWQADQPGFDTSFLDSIREQKQRELSNMQDYARLRSCYMEYLTTYLGDQGGYQCRTCGQCRASNFPVIRLSERMLAAATRFLEEEFLPRIEKHGSVKRPLHEAGWSLSYHGTTRIGRLVRASKYEDGGPFAQSLVSRAVEVVRTRYPLEAIDAVVSVPPTRSGMLVETFARQVADQLGLEYVSALVKVRQTQEQKSFSNWLQKKENVKDAFAVPFPEQIAGRTLLLIGHEPPDKIRGLAAGTPVVPAASPIVSSLSAQWRRQPGAGAPLEGSWHHRTLLQFGAFAVQG